MRYLARVFKHPNLNLSLRQGAPAALRLAVLSTAILLSACGGDNEHKPLPEVTFSYSGLTGHIVKQLTAYDEDEALYAATDLGIYQFDDGEWQLVSPVEWDVFSIAVLYPSHLLASVQVDGEYQLMESLNTGATWAEVDNNFGVEVEGDSNEAIRAMVFDEQTGVLHAVGLAAFAASEDFGRTWTLLDGAWQMFATGLSALAQNPATGDFWFGGQGAIENPVLKQLQADDNQAVDHSAAAGQLLEVPSVIKAVRFTPEQDPRVIASGEGGLIVSANDGNDWQPLYVNHNARFYFDVLFDGNAPNTFYTAGWNKNFTEPQPLILDVSVNGGADWHPYELPDPALRGGVWSMRWHEYEGERKIFLGLCNGGVYQATIEW